MICENAHDPIIDRELFNRVQGMLKHKKFSEGRSYHFPHLLSGLIECENCGNKFSGWTKQGNDHTYRYYTCAGYMRSGKSVCRSVHVLADEMENLAVSSIHQLIADPQLRKDIRPILKAAMTEEFGPGAKAKEGNLLMQLGSLGKQIHNLIEALKTGGQSATLMMELSRLEEAKRKVEVELGEMKANGSSVIDLDEMTDEAMGFMDDFDDLWKRCATNTEKKEFLKTFIHKVTVKHGPESIEATYHLYKLPYAPINRPARDAMFGIPGNSSLKSIAGVGFEPTTSRL